MSDVIKRLGGVLIPHVRRQTVERFLQDRDLAIDGLFPVLRTCSLFCSLNDADLQALIGCMRPVARSRDAWIMREGSRARGLMLLVTGSAEIMIARGGQQVKLATVTRQAVLGEECLVGERSYRASARATSETTLLALSLRRFGRFAAAHLVPGMALTEALAKQRDGAEWLPVRAAPEHERMRGESHVVPLGELRTYITARAPKALQICAAARPSDAALAAFLIQAWGYQAVFLRERRISPTGGAPS